MPVCTEQCISIVVVSAVAVYIIVCVGAVCVDVVCCVASFCGICCLS